MPIQVERVLGGATNHNYILKWGSQYYFLRLGGDVSYLGIDLQKEYLIAKTVETLNISPKPLLYLPDQKILVTEFIPLKKEATVPRVIQSIKKLHDSAVVFPWQSTPFEIIKNYIDQLKTADVVLPSVVNTLLIPLVEKLERTLILEIAPCHLDLHKGNFIDDGHHVWLIDWEYAAMSDPYFDLATWCSADFFSDQQMKDLVLMYDGDNARESYLYSMRFLADVRWMLWAYLQKEFSTINYPYQQSADRFLNEAVKRCQKIKE
ncbi:MAG: phosphotransferase [Parachlamydiales bacterium]|nr:phosphotransferase [Parachlamydiales bacterium]